MSRNGTGNLAAATALLALTAFCAPGCGHDALPAEPPVQSTRVDTSAPPNVIVLVIDGPRYDHIFGDPSHAFIPRMWNDLRPQGTLFTDFRNVTWTLTISGHCSIATGVWQQLNNEGLERPADPTIFEYYRYATGAPAGDAIVVGGKSKLDVCAYSTHASYGAAYGATADVGYATDIDTWERLETVLATDHPRLVMASLSQVDLKAHTGVFADYARQIEIADSLVGLVWDFVQADTFYANRTYLFVTADHGRHDDAHGGFQNHGDTCDGCRHIPLLALGPDIQSGHTVATMYGQRDLCTTIGDLLGVPTPYSQGVVLTEMFVPVTTGILE